MRKVQILLTAVIPTITLIILFTFLNPPAVQADPMVRIITEDTTFALADSPHVFTATYTLIEPGVTVTVEAGVEIQMPTMGFIQIRGTLLSQGTQSQPILFTAVNETAPGEWDGIFTHGNGTLSMTHTTVQYGITSIGIYNNSSFDPITIQNSTFRQNLSGLRVSHQNLHLLQMDNVTFEQNEKNRVIIEFDSSELEALTANTTLYPQSGLEGYELWADSEHNYQGYFFIPEGITLTMEAGTTLFLGPLLQVQGHLSAKGTNTQPITITEIENSDQFGMNIHETGSLDINFTNITGTGENKYGIGVAGDGEKPISIRNSVIDVSDVSMIVMPISFPRLQMENVTFAGEGENYVYIDAGENYSTFTDSSTLTSHSGLDGYYLLYDDTYFQNLYIAEGVTVTMEAGTSLLMPEDAALFAYGALHTEGTAVSPVTFTSNENNPAAEWGGILAYGNVDLNYTIVEYGERNIVVPDTAVSPTITINNSHIRHATEIGLLADAGQININCSIISDNGSDGIWVSNNVEQVEIHTTQFLNNLGAGLRSLNSSEINAINNYWGDPSGPSGDGSGTGQAVFGNVLYDPWQTEPSCTDLPTTTWQIFVPFVLK